MMLVEYFIVSNKDNMETEYCVKCGEATPHKKTDHVDARTGYVEGAGQLCIDCHAEIYWSSNIDADSYWLDG